jgi:ureidoglycolate dehydrogenase (NAD+)
MPMPPATADAPATAEPRETRWLPAEALQSWAQAAFTATGLSAAHASTCASHLVQTSLWGIDSHGIARIPHYLERLSRGSIIAQPVLRFEKTAAATGSVDGGHGHGLVVMTFAMEKAIALAREAGVGIVGIRNSSHCGAIGLYTRQATQSGMIGIAFTHSDSFVAPHGGTRAFFGTNPLSIAIPSADPARPLCVDMATSIVPWNRIANARIENQPIPPDLALDASGRSTTDPHAAAALRPMAGHKGFALAFLIDMLCGPLNGMAFGPHLTPMYGQLDEHRRLGSLVIAFDPMRFGGGAHLRDMIATAVREVKAQGDDIQSPGEPEYRCAESRAQTGIPIDPGLQSLFSTWSERLKISAPHAA